MAWNYFPDVFNPVYLPEMMWINCDNNDPGFRHLTGEQIVEDALDMNLEESNEKYSSVQKKVSHEPTSAYIEGLINF